MFSSDPRKKYHALALALFVGFVAAPAAQAVIVDDLVIWSGGDSITYGVETMSDGSTIPQAGDSLAGFRFRLNTTLTSGDYTLLDQDRTINGFRFLGGLDMPDLLGGADLANDYDQHYGIRGVEADGIDTGLFEGVQTPATYDQASDIGDSYNFGNDFSPQSQRPNSLRERIEKRGTLNTNPFNESGASEFVAADVNLVHIGTNTLLQLHNTYADSGDSINDQALAVATEASTQASSLLQTLEDTYDATADIAGFENALNTTTFVARVIPLSVDFWGGSTADVAGGFIGGGIATDGNLTGELLASYYYNYGDTASVTQGVSGGGHGAALGLDEVVSGITSGDARSIVLVDFFRIDINDLNLADLAASQGLTEAEVLNLINTDGDTYVDWVTNFTEDDSLTIDGDEVVNMNLLGDGIHPTDLGYNIMSQVWTNALQDNGYIAAVPEPTTMLLVYGLGCAGLLRRRAASA